MTYQGIRVTTEVYELIRSFRIRLIRLRVMADVPTLSEVIKEAIDRYPIKQQK